jgi:ribosomal protein S18 acetylase RimI-like enzyme
MDFKTPHFELRPATGNDLQFCWSLYRDLMMPLTVELLEWNESGQRRVVEQAVLNTGTSVIVVDGSDVGWLEIVETPHEIYLAQLYVTSRMQNRGIGTAFTRRLFDRAREEAKVVTLDVMKNNRVRTLYERLGFRVVSSSAYKLKMQWQKSA